MTQCLLYFLMKFTSPDLKALSSSLSLFLISSKLWDWALLPKVLDLTVPFHSLAFQTSTWANLVLIPGLSSGSFRFQAVFRVIRLSRRLTANLILFYWHHWRSLAPISASSQRQCNFLTAQYTSIYLGLLSQPSPANFEVQPLSALCLFLACSWSSLRKLQNAAMR